MYICICILSQIHINMGVPDGATGNESACQYRRCKSHSFDPWVQKVP